MNPVRLGIVGLGGMGTGHALQVLQGEVPGMELAAVCDIAPDLAERYPQQKIFHSPEEMFASGVVDAVLIATPHYSHTTIGISALQAGLHVLVEKPMSVHKADGEKLLAAHRSEKQVFAVMLNMRMRPAFQKIKQLIDEGELGEIRRIQWTITDWFRSHAYYASGSWRGTWEGEGGGVLINQCPHQLDLWQWMFGMPESVYARCNLGRYHEIEVEDDVFALLEYPDGKAGVFVTSTGEAPGENSLEVVGERGRLVLKGSEIAFQRNEIEMTEFSRITRSRMGERPPTWDIRIPVPDAKVPERIAILRNFANAILHGEKLVAPGREGIHSVELGNAMLLSSLNKTPVRLPMNGAEFENALKSLIARSEYSSSKQAELGVA